MIYTSGYEGQLVTYLNCTWKIRLPKSSREKHFFLVHGAGESSPIRPSQLKRKASALVLGSLPQNHPLKNDIFQYELCILKKTWGTLIYRNPHMTWWVYQFPQTMDDPSVML